MAAFILATKLFAPPLRTGWILRQRLVEQLNTSSQCKLTLVSAPAGYGKTTLVSSWLQETDIPSAWLSLDEGDNDPIRFFQYFITSLRKLIPDIGADLPGMLQSVQPPSFDVLINLLINETIRQTSPFFVVLDDFHVIYSQPVLDMVMFLLEHMPPHMHLVLLSRVDPPFPLSRLRVRNQLVDIRADQLRFTLDEIAVFLNEIMGLRLPADDLDAIGTRTEGWIAGLQLAALSMQNCRDIHGFVSAFTGSHYYVMDYLVEEVLKSLPTNINTFLLQSSILNRLCGPLCEAVIDADPARPVDGQATLETLEQMNLFLIPLDEERHWYRYHHLFADVLNKRLEHQFPHLRPELHRRASQWYEQNGFLAESINQAIAAGDQDRAAHLIEENGCFLLMSGEVSTFLNWTSTIEFQSEAHPWLAIQKAWALALTGDLERVEPTLQAPEKLLAPLVHTMEVRTLLGTIAAARAQCANSRGNSQLAAEYAQEALRQLPDCSSISQSIRSVATSILGDASWVNGNLKEAIQAYTEAIQIGREAKNLNMVIIANSNIADILMTQGQLHRAADTYTQSLQMAVRPDGQRSPLAAKIFVGMGRLSYEWNRLDDAEQNIRQCMELSRIWRDIGQQAYACAIQARLEQARNNPEKAHEAMREAELLIGEHPLSPHWSIQVRADLTRVWLAQGNLESPSQRIQKRGLKINDEIPYQRESEYVLLLRVLLAQGDHEAAIILSTRLLQQAEATGQVGLVIESLILQALAYQGKKEAEQALAALERALALAKPEGYVRIFLDEGEAMTRLLCQAQSRQVGNGYASELLSRIGKISGMTQPSMQLLAEPLTTREVEVLKLIEAGSSNQEISEQLVISIATVKRHISNIYTKLGVKSRTQALAIGKELKIFE
jgi:LuxR family transcriptional regulator, maltose regulon positive regulatory protein